MVPWRIRVADIGAHTEVYSLFGARAGSGSVYAFEPVPVTYAHLVENVRANPTLKIEPVQAAVSDQNGTAEMGVSTDLSMCSLNEAYDRASTVSVQTLRLDDRLERVDVIKLDIEGHQDAAPRGMGRLLRECSPRILFECNPIDPADEIEDILHSSGYRLYHVDRGKFVGIDALRPRERTSYDFIAIQ